MAGAIGDKLATAINAKTLRDWHRAMSTTPPTVRGRTMPFDARDAEQIRARQQSANRVLTIIKAALQHARNAEMLPDTIPDYWRQVKPFSIGDEGTPRMLEPDEITRLLNASPPDLRELLTAALMTGARYGELCELKVRDYHRETDTMRIAQGKTGKVLTQPLTVEGARFFAALTAGRAPADTLLKRSDGRTWTTSATSRPLKIVAAQAKVEDVSIKVTRATYGKLLLLATQDIEIVAKALGHSDSRITRKHYAAYLPSELARAIARLPALGIEATAKVQAIR